MKAKTLFTLTFFLLFLNTCKFVFADGIIKVDPSQNIDQGAYRLKAINDKLYFNVASNRYIQYDGEKFSDLPSDFNPITVYNMLVFKNNYYFERETGRIAVSLFKSDGSTEEVVSNAATSDLLIFHDTMYYGSYNNNPNYEYIFLKYDGNAKPVEVANLGSRRISFMEIVNDKIILFAHNNVTLSIASYDGKTFSWLFKDMPISTNYDFSGILFNGKIIFSYNSAFWMYDGIDEPKKFSDVYPEFDLWGTRPYFTLFKDKLYFAAYENNHGSELWSYDGFNSPVIVADIAPGSRSSHPSDFTVARNKFYFTADNADTGYELWEFDGVQEPQVVDDYKGTASSYPQELTVFRDNLYFTATRDDEVREIYTVYTNCSTIQETSCDSFAFNSKILKQSGWYYDTLTDNQGNDSIVKLGLTIVKSSFSNVSITACNEFNAASGKYKWTTSGVYSDTIPNAFGCDSIITVNLTVNHSSESSLIAQSCDFYVSPGGRNWITSGIYTDTIPSSCGCDSIMTINLSVYHVDTTVIQDRNVLVSADLNASHQWIDADNNLPIEDETYLTYTPDHNGRFAVIVTQGTCVDTSSVYTVIVNKTENFSNENIQLFPNPAKGKVTIDLGKIYDEATVSVLNSSGMIIQEIKMKNAQNEEIILNEPGMYLVKVRTGDGETIHRVIKQ